MNKEEMKAKLDSLNAKMKEMGEKTKDSLDTAYIMSLEAKDKVDTALNETKSSVNALKENYRIFSERAKGKASSELLKAQMNFDVAKKEMEAKKELKAKEDLAKYVDDMIEYAEACAVLSEIAAEEAKLARLEAVKAELEYEEKYGEDK